MASNIRFVDSLKVGAYQVQGSSGGGGGGTGSLDITNNINNYLLTATGTDTINCEAAHIKPFASGGNHAANNGLLLSRDLHWAFDRGCFTIDQSYEVRVHNKMKNSLLSKYEGKKITLPKDQNFWPSMKNTTHHINEIFFYF